MNEKNKDNNESREKLIGCAKKEFLEKGFAKASLRKIAADAGMTTGAVYFFFKDKDGLLGGVISEALDSLMKLLDKHFAEDTESDLSVYQQQDGDHDEFAEELVNVIYDNFDEMTILLDRSAGSKYGGIVEQIIAKLDYTYITMAERYAAVMPGKHANKVMLHWLTHVQVDAFIHMMNHFTDRQEAMRFIKPVMDYLIKGWITYALEDDT
ncbi:TetR/AcrR family transcriptional regulator [Ruminococcus sp.]|uniref:TetR/AcrR family transcriptional regulator n=1 Tax=Ruminococcus sp. TaxID=41978 RepID=UPI0025FC5DE5|nr:TetR/AcrR family transcriptional regulator [Ruminococcus sp.]MBQ8965656.1 TetR/AcrR family transcriptional regulator [Ruminococcus sp.]